MERERLVLYTMSVFNAEHNVLFIHVPKTAGTSMERRKFLGAGGHGRIVDYPDVGNGVFKFGFVRNPWDRFVSGFFCQTAFTGVGKDVFNKYIREECSNGATPARAVHSIHFIPQWFFLLDNHGSIGVDFVGRFETIQRDWKYVCDRVGVSSELGHERKRIHDPYRDYYTPESWDTIANLYRRDIDLFGYESAFEARQ